MHATVTITDLVRWHDNLRRNRSPDAILQMVASLRKQGQIQPLLVQKQPNSSCAQYIVIDGETRRLALRTLLAQGELEPDHPIHVWVLPEDLNNTDLTAIALASNSLRQPLNPIDESEAFATLLQRGFHIRAIAEIYGLTERMVRQRLSLAQLSEDARQLVRQGKRALGWAQAMTVATPDQQARICAAIATDPKAFPDGPSVRAELQKTGIPVAYALFDHALLADCLQQDLFDPEGGMFTDRARFIEAQRRAIEERRVALQQTHARVHLVTADHFHRDQWIEAQGAGDAVIVVHPSGRVDIHEGLLPLQITDVAHTTTPHITTPQPPTTNTNQNTSAPRRKHSTPAYARSASAANTLCRTLSTEGTLSLRRALLEQTTAAMALVIAATLNRTPRTPALLLQVLRQPTTSTPNDHALRAADHRAEALIAQIRTAGSGLAKALEALTRLDPQDVAFLFTWLVGRALLLPDTSETRHLAHALGRPPLSGWRLTRTVLASLTREALEEAAKAYGITPTPNTDLIEAILQAEDERVAQAPDTPPHWIPPASH